MVSAFNETIKPEKQKLSFLENVTQKFDNEKHRGFINKAYLLALKKHDKVVRFHKEGPTEADTQVDHVTRVAMDVYNQLGESPDSEKVVAIVAALLHDVVEDTDISLKFLKEKFGERVVTVVVALSHKKDNGMVDENESPASFLGKIEKMTDEKLKSIAIVIRRCDRLDNLDTLEEAPARFVLSEMYRVREAISYVKSGDNIPLWQKLDDKGYTLIKERFEKIDLQKYYREVVMDNLRRRSRTVESGQVDVGTSQEKRVAVTTTEVKNIDSNFERAVEYLLGMVSKKDYYKITKHELRGIVFTVAKKINEGVVNENNMIRNFDSTKYAYVKHEEIEEIMDSFFEELVNKLHSLRNKKELINIAAWVEYQINIRGHFFTDGCGRISMAVAAFVLMMGRLPLPNYPDIIHYKEAKTNFYSKEHIPVMENGVILEDGKMDAWVEYYETFFDI